MKGTPVDIWYFDTSKPRLTRKGIYSPHKVFLYELIHRSITRHNISECFWALKLLPRMTNIDPYVIFRFIMIMIHSIDDKLIEKNFIIYLEALISKLDVAKPDIFVEFLSYFLSNNRVEDARDLFNQRYRFMTYLYHREVPLVNINIGCYDFLFNYLAWKDKLPSDNVINFDVSIQGWLVNAMSHLKQVETNHELFVMCISDVLVFYRFHKKAYLFLSQFQRTNQDNITAQLLLFNLIKSLSKSTPKRQRTDPSYNISITTSDEEEERQNNRRKELDGINNFIADECNIEFDLKQYPITSDKKNILDNLCRLDMRRNEVMELSASYYQRIEALQLIMDSLEYLSEIRNPTRWRYLQDILIQITTSNDESFLSEVCTLWQTRYREFWKFDDILVLAIDRNTPDAKVKHRKLIKDVLRILNSFNTIEETMIIEESGQVLDDDEYYDIDWL